MLQDFVFLTLHPLDVLDFIVLHLEVVAGLPVGFALFVLLRIELLQLQLDGLDLGLDGVKFFLCLALLLVGSLEVLPDEFHLAVEHLLFRLDLLDLSPDLVLLCLEFLDLGFNSAELLRQGDRLLQLVDLFDDFGLLRTWHGRRRQSSLQVLHLLLDVLDSVALGVHLLEHCALFLLQAFNGGDYFAHLVLILPLCAPDTLGLVDALGQLSFASIVSASSNATFSHILFLLDQLVLLASRFLNAAVLLRHISVELSFARLLKAVLRCWEFFYFCVFRKLNFLVLYALHVVVLVNPAILVLWLVVLARTALSLVLTSGAATSRSFRLFDSLCIVCLLASGLRSSLSTTAALIFTASLSCGTLGTAAFAAARRRLRPLLCFGIACSSFALVLFSSGLAYSLRLLLHGAIGLLKLYKNVYFNYC